MKNIQLLILVVTILTGCTTLVASSTSSKSAYKVDYDYSQDESETVHFTTNDRSLFVVANSLLNEFPGIEKENAKHILSLLRKKSDQAIKLPISSSELQSMLNFVQGVKPSFKDFSLEDFNNMRLLADRIGLAQSHKDGIIKAAPFHYAWYLRYQNQLERHPGFVLATGAEVVLLATTILCIIAMANSEHPFQGGRIFGKLVLTPTLLYSLIYFTILCNGGFR